MMGSLRSALKTSLCIVAVGLCSTVPAVAAEVIHETKDPFGGPFGIWGFDICRDQSVGVRFTPDGSYRLGQLRLWLWNNDGLGGTPRIVITLRDDDSQGGESVPGKHVFEMWELDVPNTGGANPVLFDFDSVARPRVEDGVNYWVVAESDAAGGFDPVWAIASTGAGFVSVKNPPSAPWSPGGMGAVPAFVVLGAAAFPLGDLNCDGLVDFGDINPFVLALTNPAGYEAQFPDCDITNGDINGDGKTDFGDINPFVRLLTGS